MSEFENLSKEELEKRHRELIDLLDEIEEERQYVLGQTGLHLPGVKNRQYENEMREIKERLKIIEDLLQKQK